jgi:hypothetical protein
MNNIETLLLELHYLSTQCVFEPMDRLFMLVCVKHFKFYIHILDLGTRPYIYELVKKMIDWPNIFIIILEHSICINHICACMMVYLVYKHSMIVFLTMLAVINRKIHMIQLLKFSSINSLISLVNGVCPDSSTLIITSSFPLYNIPFKRH